MKKFAICGLTLGLLIIAALIFWRHQNHPSDAEIRQKLPGAWIPNITGDLHTIYILSADGHWTGLLSGKQTTGRMGGTWLVKGGYYISTTTNSDFSPNPNNLRAQIPATNSSRIIRIDEREFVLQVDANRQVVFKKAK